MIAYYAAPGISKIKMLPQILNEELQYVEAENIFNQVCKFHQVEPSVVLKRGRKRENVRVRQQAIYLIKYRVKGIIWNKIAEIFGDEINYDHSDCIHAYNVIKDQVNLQTENPDKTDIQNLLLII